ncbi:MAG: response regulator [Rhodospirillales bacterium]|nr:response regulator [Rhodospirillales bacterium]
METSDIMDNAESVNVLLVVPETGMSSNVSAILRNCGFVNITIIKSLDKLEKHLDIPVPDIIICSAEFPQGDSCDLIKNLRLSDIGKNPFIPIITITADPSKEFVQKIISTGTDALMAVPFSAQQLMDRINGIIGNRKQFVATSDYLGPDRRPNSRGKNDMKITKFDVPNTLRDKITGEEPPERVGKTIRTMMDEMLLFRLDRQSDQIIYLVGKIKHSCEMGEVDPHARSLIESLQDVARDVIIHMEGTAYEHVSGLCESLLQVIHDIPESSGEALRKNLKLLSQLSLAIQVGFTSTQSAEAALQISDTIGHGN